MKSRLVLSALVAGLLSGSIAQAVPTTEIVFGNLGGTGTDPISSVSNNSVGQNGSNNNVIAIAFNTGTTSANLAVQKIQLGLGGPTGGPTPLIQIVADNAGLPTGAVLGSLTTGALTDNNLYDFTPTSAINLSSATKYWFRVSDSTATSNASSFNWYYNDDTVTPSAQNGSGYSYATPNGSQISLDGGSSWSAFSAGRFGAFNLLTAPVPVPEPSTYALGAIGLAVLGYARSRRRKLVA